MIPSTHPLFWRDAALPFVELRQVLDGRDVSYAPHSHEEWSIGAILDGQSEFLCADRLHTVERGTLVMMNPDVVHACNPSQDSPWAYYMMHLNKEWLAALLREKNVIKTPNWQGSLLDTLVDKTLYEEFIMMCESLMSTALELDEKEQRVQHYFISLFTYLDNSMEPTKTQLPANKLYEVADYLNQYCLEETPINLVSAKFGFSTGYLVRAFKCHFNMTPHAYRLNRRVQLGQQALKKGKPIAEVAQAIGFSDQAHFQRVFKKRVAATPDQYRRSVSQA
ncbi:AraC family transcriptional regulator [Marinomonas ushuaiensis DSM 15871]|uniref:AraC family transcriptional regulator n=1 Tax=Marinomonas ushuaiensis DSM 15871 TaxID=1122207 RepID=X7EBK6_9GAMM|nr:AraC family transcriptional regulator [Marinomonas ushuaiensis]ETX12488.1 AraC family transcriptional regulator [Marinomonas ushuaiensis DSM 15871]